MTRPLGFYLDGDPTAIYLLEAQLRNLTTDKKLRLITWLSEAIEEETNRQRLRQLFGTPRSLTCPICSDVVDPEFPACGCGATRAPAPTAPDSKEQSALSLTAPIQNPNS